MVHAVSGEIEEYRSSNSFVAMPKPVRIGRLRPVRSVNLESVYDSDLMDQVSDLESEIGTLQEDVTEDQLSAMVSETLRYFSGVAAVKNRSLYDIRSENEAENLKNRRDLINSGFEYFTESHSWINARDLIHDYSDLEGCSIVVTDRYDTNTKKTEPGRVDLFYKLPKLEN